MPAMNARKEIAQELRDAIRKANEGGMTYRQMADAADVSYQLIAKFVTDPNKTITLESAQKIAVALGYTLTLK